MCHAGAGATTIITAPSCAKYKYAARLSFALEIDRCTNNIARYEVVILGLRKLRALGARTCIVKTDSKVVDGPKEKYYAAREPVLLQYVSAVRSMEKKFKGFTIHCIDRNKNEEANALTQPAARGDPMPSNAFFQVIEVRAPRGGGE
jgi:ribonuclease HI